VELVAEAFDRNPPWWKRTVKPVRCPVAAERILPNRLQATGPQGAPDLDLEARRGGTRSAVLEDGAESRRTRAPDSAEHLEAPLDRQWSREPAVNRVLDDGSQVFVVEDASEVNHGSGGAGEPDLTQHPNVVHIDVAPMHHDQVRLRRVFRRHPDLGLPCSESVEPPERAGGREADR
jgi:hypothetical protein